MEVLKVLALSILLLPRDHLLGVHYLLSSKLTCIMLHKVVAGLGVYTLFLYPQHCDLTHGDTVGSS